MNEGPRVHPPRQVPTLTEVVDEDAAEMRPLAAGDFEDEAVAAAFDRSDVQPMPPTEPLPEAPSPDRAAEQQLVERVLADVQRQIDPVLEQRLREMLAPMLARWSEALVEDSRERLASVLRDVVAQAVAREFERQRRR